jgi:hypothetical protein
MTKTTAQLDTEILVATMDKRSRLALRTALGSGGLSSAPSLVVRKLEKLGFARRTGHVFEQVEWGKVVRRLPSFMLTPAGEVAAKIALARIGSSL